MADMTTEEAGIKSQGADSTRPAAVVLQLREVEKAFGTVQAVAGVDLEIRKGEIVTLLGPSGCGKTTTLRMVIGLEEPTGGQIVYQQKVLASPGRRSVPVHRRRMGMVFQSYAIWPHMTVARNVEYPLRVQGMKRAERQDAVDRVLAMVGMAELADRPATKLSGGQQQRVALARALVFEPELLLLDEPFSNLDARLRAEMRAEVKRLQKRLGITVLFVTHDQVEALALSDRVAVMNSGRIEQLATPQDLYESPRTAFVRDFLGESIKLPGVVHERVGDTLAVRPDGLGDVRLSGRVAEARPFRVGDRCEVSIRPEHLIAGDASDANENLIPGTIVNLLYMGERYEVSVELSNGELVRANLPTDMEWQEGDEIFLLTSRDHVLVWESRQDD